MDLILLRGRPATGKTLLSSLLSARINIPIIRKDDIYDAISTLNPDHQLRNQAVYNTLYAILKSNRPSQAAIILDFPFQFDDDIQQLRNWCTENSVQLKSIVVTCSDESLWAERFNKRAENPAPNQLITNFEALKKRYGNMQLKAAEDELLIDSINTPEECLKNVLVFLKFTKF